MAGVTAALNKAWKFGLDQLDTFRDNLERTKKLFQKRTSAGKIISWEEAIRMRTFPVPKDLRIICNRDHENEKAIAFFRLFGARIRHRSKSVPSGSHRLGVTGHDPFLEQKLREAFLQEWESCGPDVEK